MPSPQMQAIIADLNRHRHIFDADVVGEGVLDIAAEQAYRRFDQAVDPDGNPWPALSEAYARWKAKYGLGMQMGVLTGVMAGDLEEFKGDRYIGKDEARSTYGTSEESREHAANFEDGDPRRAFTAMCDVTVQLIDDYLDKHHAKSL